MTRTRTSRSLHATAWRRRLSALVVIGVLVLIEGCQTPAPQSDAQPTSVPTPVDAAGTVDPAIALEPPQTEPTQTEPPQTEPTQTEPPQTEPTQTEIGPTIDTTATFDVRLAPEASGIAVGRGNPDVYWIINDGPEEGFDVQVLALTPTGSTIGQIPLVHTDGSAIIGFDVEDIASGPCGPADPTPCLFVGDIGDNLDQRDDIQVHRFAEPDPTTDRIEVATATYTYADGPRNAEALAVTDQGAPVIVSKEDGVAGIYVADQFADQQLSRTGSLTIPAPASPFLTQRTGLSITAADLSSTADRMLLRTYDSVLELTAPAVPPDLSTIETWSVVEVTAPFEPQGEAIAYLPGDNDYVTVSERSGRISVVRRPG